MKLVSFGIKVYLQEKKGEKKLAGKLKSRC